MTTNIFQLNDIPGTGNLHFHRGRGCAMPVSRYLIYAVA